MKKILIVIGVLVVIAGVALGIVWYATGGARQAVDQFFTQIKAGDLQGAYQGTAKEFQAQTSYNQFTAFLENFSLKNYQGASWGSMSVQTGGTGQLEGNINTQGGGVVPIQIDLVKENGAWKIFNLSPKTGGLTPSASTSQTQAGLSALQAGAIPSQEEVARLVQDTMILFADAVKNGQESYAANNWLEHEQTDFAAFYNAVAEVWKTQTGSGELRTTFSDFITKNIDIGWIKAIPPALTAVPALNQDNVLVVKGEYNSEAMSIPFELGYYFETPAWKLVQIEVKAR